MAIRLNNRKIGTVELAERFAVLLVREPVACDGDRIARLNACSVRQADRLKAWGQRFAERDDREINGTAAGFNGIGVIARMNSDGFRLEQHDGIIRTPPMDPPRASRCNAMRSGENGRLGDDGARADMAVIVQHHNGVA